MELTTEGYCEKHKSDASGRRLSSAKRGYGYRWRKARERFLASHLFCEECRRNGVAPVPLATDVDHITPHKGDPVLFWDKTNWQALCHECHSRKTASEDGGFGHGIPPYPRGF